MFPLDIGEHGLSSSDTSTNHDDSITSEHVKDVKSDLTSIDEPSRLKDEEARQKTTIETVDLVNELRSELSSTKEPSNLPSPSSLDSSNKNSITLLDEVSSNTLTDSPENLK